MKKKKELTDGEKCNFIADLISTKKGRSYFARYMADEIKKGNGSLEEFLEAIDQSIGCLKKKVDQR